MKKLIVLSVLCLLFSQYSSAQKYHTAIGVRLGSSVPAIKSGVTVKQFIGHNALEAIVSFGDGVALCGLFEIHKSLGTRNLNFLIGFGGYTDFAAKLTRKMGAVGIIGLDYKVPAIPLNLTLDWKPELNLVTKVGFEPAGLGLSVRYAF